MFVDHCYNDDNSPTSVGDYLLVTCGVFAELCKKDNDKTTIGTRTLYTCFYGNIPPVRVFQCVCLLVLVMLVVG